VARKKQSPVSVQDRKIIGGLLRDIRRAAGYRSVESAAATKGCPASRQTIYAYERGGLVPSLPQFLELVEFFVLEAPMLGAPGAKPGNDLRAHGVAAVTRALTLTAYHMTQATDLVARMQPDLGAKA
jgi:DNA-binding XRE family transcriptional regulator